MLVIIYSKLLILAVRQKDTKSYRPPLVKAACHKQVFLWIADPGTHLSLRAHVRIGAVGNFSYLFGEHLKLVI